MMFSCDPSWLIVRSALALSLVLTGACQVYDPTLVQRDAGAGRCEGRRPPSRPTDADSTESHEVLFGLRDVVLRQSEGRLWTRLGFNLDGYCTGAPDYGHACTTQDRPPSDGEDGIDNVFGERLFPLVNAVVPNLEETARAAQLNGMGLPVLVLREWNGTPNDPRVHVSITQAVVTVPPAEDGAIPDIVINEYRAELPDGSSAPAPRWEGDDYTWVRADTFLAGNPEEPLVYDNNAYVADGVVVVSLPARVEFLFPADEVGVTVRLTGGVATGRISADGRRLEDVVVGGRWSVVDLLRTAENVGVCMGTSEYSVLRSQLESFADVSSEVDADPGVECDAVSIGVGFTGYRLQLGGVAEGRPVESTCNGLMDGGATEADGGVGSLDAGT